MRRPSQAHRVAAEVVQVSMHAAHVHNDALSRQQLSAIPRGVQAQRTHVGRRKQPAVSWEGCRLVGRKQHMQWTSSSRGPLT